MTKIIACKYCGKEKSKSGINFTQKSVWQHIRDKHRKELSNEPETHIDFELTDMIGGDLPDGAFFALAWELGEL